MTAYYNEWDAQAAAWLRELIKQGHIADGVVDERDIKEVEPADLREFTQCHFFAGIGGWSVALRLAGWADDRPVWTGSPPCQPFSVAGRGKGIDDDRHIAPVWLDLVKECRPPILFGEQVAAATSKDGWLDSLQDALENEGYATGAAVLPACSVNAPHIRQRLWFTARLGDTQQPRLEGHAWTDNGTQGRAQSDRSATETGVSGGLGYANNSRSQRRANFTSGQAVEKQGAQFIGTNSNDSANAPKPQWGNPDWLWCRDGKWRPVEPSTFPLAHGIPARVGRLRGYGNAIVPQVAAEVIQVMMEYGND